MLSLGVHRNGISLITYENAMECFYRERSLKIPTLSSLLSWLCLLKRTPVANQNQVSISRGTRDEIPFASCHWSELAAVGGRCLPTPTLLPWKTQSQTAVYSSQASYDVPPLYREPFRRVGQGLILHGGHSAMVPIERLPDGSVRWHFGVKEAQGPGQVPRTCAVSSAGCIRRADYKFIMSARAALAVTFVENLMSSYQWSIGQHGQMLYAGNWLLRD